MDRAEKHPSCHYCEPVISKEDPYAIYRATWDSKEIRCYERPPAIECHHDCGQLETCGTPICTSYHIHGAGETPACLGCPAGVFPPRLISHAITPVPLKPALHSERPCNRVRYHSLPVMKPLFKAPLPDAYWYIDEAMDCHFRNCGKGTAWRYTSRGAGVKRDNEIFVDCTTNKPMEICPTREHEKPGDCFLSPGYETSMFSMPPCQEGSGYGPCEEATVLSSHHPMPDRKCGKPAKVPVIEHIFNHD